MNSRVKLYGRASFLRVAAPERFQGKGDPRYSGNIIFPPKGEDHKKTLSAMRAAAADQWGEAKADAAVKALLKANKVALVDGDTKPDLAGYPGNMIVQAHAKPTSPPTLVASENGVNVALDRETQTKIYSGCYVYGIIDFWAQDNQWGKRINATLCGLQFVKDGEPFSGGRPAGTDDFEVVDEEPGMPGFDDDDGGEDQPEDDLDF